MFSEERSIKPRVAVVTLLPSPYQIELFDAVAAAGRLDLHVVYLQRFESGRLWSLPDIQHSHSLLPDGFAAAEAAVRGADLTVFGNYRAPVARRWLADRVTAGRRCVLWGERPGFRHSGWLGRWVRAWRLRAFRRSRGMVWGIGSWAVAGWRKELGDRHRFVNVPYFSDLARFTQAAALRRVSKQRRLLFSGALIPRKGVDLLVRAFVDIAASRPDCHLDVMGAGPLEPKLRRWAAPRAEQVRFLGFRDWADLPAAYAKADVLCVPSRHDGWGLVVPEGLAAGLPVLATDRTGAALDLIQPGHNGWRVPAGDYKALRDALAEIVDQPAERLQQLSQAAQQSVVHHQLADGVRCWVEAAQAALAE